MDQALELAGRGRGQTSPNPMVGSVVVSPLGVVVGTGFHERAGEAHAEVCALREAGLKARGSTLYCTLEPCAHTGRTGPCVSLIVQAGVERVVIAVSDPNPRVSGAGISYLNEHRVQVDVGVGQAAAKKLNAAFFTWIVHGRPFVTMKIATSLDGRIAARRGAQTSITAEAASAMVHHTRAEVDAVGVGSTTIGVDDPQLTARGVSRSRPLSRIVLDRRLRTPPTARLLRTLNAGPVLIVTTDRAVRAKAELAEQLRGLGATLEPLETCEISDVMKRLGELEVTSLLLEGGATVHRAAWSAGVVDRVQRYIAPVIFGREGVQWLGDGQSTTRLREVRVEVLGPDVLMEGYV